MAIPVTCECGRKINLPDEYAGKKGKCPECGATIPIPAASEPAPVKEASEPAPVKEPPPEPEEKEPPSELEVDFLPEPETKPAGIPVKKKAAVGALPKASPKFKGAPPKRRPIHKRLKDEGGGEGEEGERRFKVKKSMTNYIIIVGCVAAVIVIAMLYYMFIYLPAAFERRLDAYVRIYLGSNLENALTGFVDPDKHTTEVRDAIRSAAKWRNQYIERRLKGKPHLGLDWEIKDRKEKTAIKEETAIIEIYVGNERMVKEHWVKKGKEWYLNADELLKMEKASKLKKK
ncbi:MAG: hypothetical protein E3J72_00705 [Planctomycetota bacterium]|nr:MAG: hypothetical protein E3J72_00705 [Planctomycetota bacterium]